MDPQFQVIKIENGDVLRTLFSTHACLDYVGALLMVGMDPEHLDTLAITGPETYITGDDLRRAVYQECV